MSHETLRDLVFKMRDGEADTAETGAARAHLETCADCRQDLDAWDKAIPELFRPVAPSEGFVRRVMDGLPLPLGGRLRAALTPYSWRWAAAGAFAAALALLYPALRQPAAPPPAVATATTAAPTDWVAEITFAEAEQGENIGTAIEEYFL